MGIKFHNQSFVAKIEDIFRKSPETLINQGFADFPLIMVMKEGCTMKSEELRQEMLAFLEENGMKKSIVAKQTGLSSSILSSWFSGRANLREAEIEAVQCFLSEKQKKFA